MSEPAELRCPECGQGVVTDLAYDEGARDGQGRRVQDPQAHQVTTFSCGHVRIGPSLAVADPDRLDVERRTADETVAPPDE